MDTIEEGRRFLRADHWDGWEALETDQRKGLSPPPQQKACPEGAALVDLTAPGELALGQMPLVEAIRRRRSRRAFAARSLRLEELSFLLWATQGVSGTRAGPEDVVWRGITHLRTVPSGGARHPFETYLLASRVQGLAPGLYRYLPLSHQLCFLRPEEEMRPLVEAAWGRRASIAGSAVVLIWTAIPYRTEWRYSILSHKLIALDAGHVCQNLYLACEAIGAGTCAVGAYSQAPLDALVGVDGEDEFVVYLAPVGKLE